jgi:hypothetical protein
MEYCMNLHSTALHIFGSTQMYRKCTNVQATWTNRNFKHDLRTETIPTPNLGRDLPLHQPTG